MCDCTIDDPLSIIFQLKRKVLFFFWFVKESYYFFYNIWIYLIQLKKRSSGSRNYAVSAKNAARNSAWLWITK